MYTDDNAGSFPGPLATQVPRGDVGENIFLPFYLRPYFPSGYVNAGLSVTLNAEAPGTRPYTCPSHWQDQVFRNFGTAWGVVTKGQASYGVSVVGGTAQEAADGMPSPV